LWDVWADLHEATKHCISPHVWLVHHEVQVKDNQRLQRKLVENSRHLVSLQQLWAPCNVLLHQRILRGYGFLIP
jgi:hypothetical protein